jgi:tetratricopeptide (TPR) repeat protein
LKATIKPAAHPLATSPKTRFILVGGVLAGIALAVAILLRLLLVPYEQAGVDQAKPNPIPPAATANQSLSPATRLPEPPSPEAPVPFESPTAPSSVGPQQPVEFYLNEARAYLDMGRLIEARTNLRKVLEIDPQNNQAQERLNLLEEEIGDKAEQHFNQAREAFDSQLYQEAMAQWEIVLSLIEPSDERYAEAWQGIEKARAELQ